jgi:hypothetical protein
VAVLGAILAGRPTWPQRQILFARRRATWQRIPHVPSHQCPRRRPHSPSHSSSPTVAAARRVATSHKPQGLIPAACDEGSTGAEAHRDDDVGVTYRRGAYWTGGSQSHSCTGLSLLPPARQLGYGFLPVPRVDLATIATARHRQEAARILRDEECNRSDDGNPSRWNFRS